MQRINIFSNKLSLGLSIGLIVLFPTLYFLVFVLPTNMDEILPYHILGCIKSYAALGHASIESCARYPANFFGINFFRSYSYVGIASSYLYQIFFNIYPSLYSHYLLGFFTLLIFSISLTKLMNLRLTVVMIPMLYFPLLFEVLHDTGPIRIALLAYPAIMYAVIKLFDSRSTILIRLLASSIIFFTVLISVEDKPFFVYLLPQILLIAFGYFVLLQYHNFKVEGRNFLISNLLNRRLCINFLLLFSALLVAFYIILLCIQIPLGSGRAISYFGSLAEQVHPIGNIWTQIKYIAKYLISPVGFAMRLYSIDHKELAISAIFFFPALFIFLKAKGRLLPFKYLFSVSVLILAGFFIYTRNTAYPHHFIFLHIPIVFLLMMYSNESPKRFLKVACILAVSSTVSVAQLVYGNLEIHSKFNKSDVFQYLQDEDLAKNSVINFSSWGAYYTQLLYGPVSQLIADRPMSVQDGADLEAIRKYSNRDYIINVCHSCSERDLEVAFPGKSITRVGPQKTEWIVWKITDPTDLIAEKSKK